MGSPRAQSRAARHEWVAPRPARRLRHTVAPPPRHPHHVVELAQCMRLIAISMWWSSSAASHLPRGGGEGTERFSRPKFRVIHLTTLSTH